MSDRDNALALRKAKAAAMVSVSERTLDRWAADGTGPPGRFKIGSSVFYERAALERWVRERAGSAQIALSA